MTTKDRIAQIADIKRRYEEGHSLDDIQFLLSEHSATTARLREAEGHIRALLQGRDRADMFAAETFLGTLPDAGQEKFNG